jgi:F-type H+-transporting ATPase subunit b
MSIFAKFSGLRIAALLAAVLLAAGPVGAQESVVEEAKEAAQEAAHEAEETERGGHDADHSAAGSPNPLAVDPDLAIWTGVIFVLLFLVLRAFAWPQITASLTEREKRIADTIAAADAKLADAKAVLADHEAKLAAAAGEVRALLEEARRDAEHTRKAIEEKGRQTAKEEMDRAVREVERAKDAAVQELAQKSANIAVDLARNVIRDKLSTEEQSKLVRDALGKLSATTPSKN